MQDLLGGQIQMLMTGLATAEGQLKGGKLRALAFTSAKRVSGAPQRPHTHRIRLPRPRSALLVRHPRSRRHAAGHRAQAKRRHLFKFIKTDQGMMQELLTGRTRLP